jgi:hypothetical protein
MAVPGASLALLDRVNAVRLFRAREGVGPLVQRDYWAVVEGCEMGPRGVADVIARSFPTFVPADLAVFHCDRDGALEVGDELHVAIRMAGEFRVRVVHRDANSITFGTLPGHPEAGRITFGAYRNRRGDVVVHIRSRARSGSRFHRAGFLGLGDPMQLYCWTDFINAVAARCGRGVVGSITAETNVIEDEPRDCSEIPTFIAEGA